MAASTITVWLTNGQTLSIWDATSEAIGAEKRCSMTGTALITSPFGFTVMTSCSIKDYAVLASTDGEFELMANGNRTGLKFPVHQGLLIGIDRRNQYKPNYNFQSGVVYGFRQTVVRSA
jgi:hypothetical protein